METNTIIDTSVAIGLKQGVITVFTVIEHPPAGKKNFDILFPELEDYVTAVTIAERLRAQGTPVGAIDILIAAMAVNRTAAVVTKDSDFSVIAGVYPEFRVEMVC